jgi:hypothetical protein
MWLSLFRIEQIKLEKWSVTIHHSIVPFCPLSKNMNIIILIIIFAQVALYGFQTWPLNFQEMQTENIC